MPQKHNGSLFSETIENADCLLKEAIESYVAENYKTAVENLSIAHKIFLAHKDIAKVSVCLSLMGLIKYINKEEGYYKSLLLLEDSKFLAESTNKKNILAINKFAFGQIYFIENKFNEALFYLTYSSDSIDEFPMLKVKAYELLALTYIRLQNTKMAYDYLEKAIHLAHSFGYKNLYARLNEISENNKNLETELAKNLDLEYVEYIASSELGMQKPASHQIVHINVPKESYTEKGQVSNEETLITKIKNLLKK